MPQGSCLIASAGQGAQVPQRPLHSSAPNRRPGPATIGGVAVAGDLASANRIRSGAARPAGHDAGGGVRPIDGRQRRPPALSAGRHVPNPTPLPNHPPVGFIARFENRIPPVSRPFLCVSGVRASARTRAQHSCVLGSWDSGCDAFKCNRPDSSRSVRDGDAARTAVGKARCGARRCRR